jgi:hypothetical protein
MSHPFVRYLTFRLLTQTPVDIVSLGENWRLDVYPSGHCTLVRIDGPSSEYYVGNGGSPERMLHELTVTGVEMRADVLPARVFDALVKCGKAERLLEPLRISFRSTSGNVP